MIMIKTFDFSKTLAQASYHLTREFVFEKYGKARKKKFSPQNVFLT